MGSEDFHLPANSASRIAFIARGLQEYSRRLASGVAEFASPTRGFILREFLMGFQRPELPASIESWSPDAVVSFLVQQELPLLDFLAAKGVPIVNAAGGEPRAGFGVVMGEAAQVYKAVHEHFAELGIANIWQFAMGESDPLRGSAQRYRNYCQTHGIGCNSYSSPDPDQVEAINQIVDLDPSFARWLLDLSKPAGIFSQNLYAGQYLCRACELLRLRVPGEIAIVGSDGFDIAMASNPPVTSIRPPAEAVGYEAARLVVSMLHGAEPPMQIVLVQGTRLVHRQSTLANTTQGCDTDRAMNFIDEHACEGIKVNDVLSHTQGVSRVTFHKRFCEQFGKTPGAAIQARRMDEARHLLVESEMSPGAIAGMCGYQDYIHFYRVFRKAEGVSPSEYRRLAT